MNVGDRVIALMVGRKLFRNPPLMNMNDYLLGEIIRLSIIEVPEVSQ